MSLHVKTAAGAALNALFEMLFLSSADTMASITTFIHSNISQLLARQAIVGKYVCK